MNITKPYGPIRANIQLLLKHIQLNLFVPKSSIEDKKKMDQTERRKKKIFESKSNMRGNTSKIDQSMMQKSQRATVRNFIRQPISGQEKNTGVSYN